MPKPAIPSGNKRRAPPGACLGAVLLLSMSAVMRPSDAATCERAATIPRVGVDSICQEGDLVFQQGTGIVPDVLLGVLHDSGGYCHVGIIVMRAGRPCVAHTDPDGVHGQRGARLEPLDDFLDPHRTPRAAIYRVADVRRSVAHRAACVAMRYATERRPFDWAFDRTRDDKLYCTELVWRAYRAAGCSLVKRQDLLERDWRGKRRGIITPGSLLHSGRLVLVATIQPKGHHDTP